MIRSATRFHADAQAEVLAAHRYYWLRSEAAADSFLLELDLALDLIAEAPARWPRYSHGTRRILLRKFPFILIYRSRGRAIQVLAVAHSKRRPGYRMKRLR